jgi:hypothetical protein
MPVTQRWTLADVARHQVRMAHDQGKAPMRELAMAADVFPALQRLARAEGWIGQHTYNALGPDDGLHIVLVRGEVVLFAYLLDEGDTPRPMQQAWIDALARTGSVEVHVWHAHEWDTITTRLTRQHKGAIV